MNSIGDMMKIKGTRVASGTEGGVASKNEESGGLKQSSSIGAAQAKVPISGVQNKAREKNSSVAPATRSGS
jgi:hypothetical protein